MSFLVIQSLAYIRQLSARFEPYSPSQVSTAERCTGIYTGVSRPITKGEQVLPEENREASATNQFCLDFAVFVERLVTCSCCVCVIFRTAAPLPYSTVLDYVGRKSRVRFVSESPVQTIPSVSSYKQGKDSPGP